MLPVCDPNLKVCLHFAHHPPSLFIHQQPVLDHYSHSSVPLVVADTGFDLIMRLKESVARENEAWIGDEMSALVAR
jgi:hypothetical protein